MPRQTSLSALISFTLAVLGPAAVAAQPAEPTAPPVAEPAPPPESPTPPPESTPPAPPAEAAPPVPTPAPAVPATTPPAEPSGALFELQDGPPTLFGDRGQFLLDAGSLASIALSTLKIPGSKLNRTDLFIHPSFGYFVIDQLLLKLEFNYARTSQDQGLSDSTDMSIGGGTGVGFDLELGAETSLLPAITARYRHHVIGARTGVTDEVTQDEVLVVLAAHFLFHPAPHFFLGLGPSWSFSVYERHDQLQDISTSRFGADAVIGVWW